MRKKIILMLIICVSISLQNLQSTILIAHPGNRQIHYSVNFPIEPDKRTMSDPNIPGMEITVYSAIDMINSLNYGITLLYIPERYGIITDSIAEEMIENSLSTQIALVRNTYGAATTILNRKKFTMQGMITHQIETSAKIQNTEIYGLYQGVYDQRLLITLWSSGINTSSNRESGNKFVSSFKKE